MIGFETVWQRIEEHAGEEFRQVRGGVFGYEVGSSYLRPDRTNQQIPRSHFEQAYSQVPMETTTSLQRFRGPSYIFAVLMDPRVKQADW